MSSNYTLIRPQGLYAEAGQVATILTDEAGAVFGVVVRRVLDDAGIAPSPAS